MAYKDIVLGRVRLILKGSLHEEQQFLCSVSYSIEGIFLKIHTSLLAAKD